MKQIYLLFIIMITAFQLQACDCVGSTVKEGYMNHSNVFTARVVDIKEGVGYGKVITVQIIKNYKGELSKTVKIRTGNGGPDCGFTFRKGEEYLIFASLGMMYANSRVELLETTYCTNTGLIAKRTQEIKTLKALQKGKE